MSGYLVVQHSHTFIMAVLSVLVLPVQTQNVLRLEIWYPYFQYTVMDLLYLQLSHRYAFLLFSAVTQSCIQSSSCVSPSYSYCNSNCAISCYFGVLSLFYFQHTVTHLFYFQHTVMHSKSHFFSSLVLTGLNSHYIYTCNV